MRRAIALAIASVAALVSTPAMACISVNAEPLPLDVQQQRQEADRQAGVTYAREMSFAVAARERSPNLNRTRDLAYLLVPNVLPAFSVSELVDGCETTIPPEVGNDTADWIDWGTYLNGERQRGVTTLPDRHALSARRIACSNALRADLAAYLDVALDAATRNELWAALLPRAITMIPPDGAQPLVGGRLVRLGDNLQLPLTLENRGTFAPYAQRRRDRAWHYLQHHANGRAIMRAITAFLETRLTADRSEARICPRVAEAG